MAKLTFLNTNEVREIAENESIGPACEEAGVPLACSEGFCGTCIIEVVEGGENLTPPTEAEVDFLGAEGVKKERMACQCHIKNGCEQNSCVKIRI
jgi:ferredoxin